MKNRQLTFSVISSALILFCHLSFVKPERGSIHEVYPSDQTTFTLTGTQSKLIPFTSSSPFFTIPLETRKKLKSIEFSYVNLEPETFFLDAIDGCDSLESISLIHVQARGGFGSKTITFPKLKNYTFSTYDYLSLSTLNQLQTFIFFNKGSHIEINEIYKLRTNVQIMSQDTLLFEINHDQKSMYFKFVNFVDDILRSCCSVEIDRNGGGGGGFDLEKLTVLFTKVSSDSIPSGLKSLTIISTDTNFYNSQLTTILSRTRELEELDIEIGVSSGTPKNILDVSTLPGNSLRVLKLEDFTLNQTKEISFPRIEKLKIHTCLLEDKFVDEFVKTFGNVKIVDVWGGYSTRLSYRFLKKIFETSVMDLTITTSVPILEGGSSTNDIEMVRGILRSAGVEQNSTSDRIVLKDQIWTRIEEKENVENKVSVVRACTILTILAFIVRTGFLFKL